MREGKAEGKRGEPSTEAMVRVQDIDAYGTRLVVQLDDAWPLDLYDQEDKWLDWTSTDCLGCDSESSKVAKGPGMSCGHRVCRWASVTTELSLKEQRLCLDAIMHKTSFRTRLHI